MSINYPAVFHLRVCRAKAELEGLTSLLERMHEACQREQDGTYDLESVDSESLVCCIRMSCNTDKQAGVTSVTSFLIRRFYNV